MKDKALRLLKRFCFERKLGNYRLLAERGWLRWGRHGWELTVEGIAEAKKQGFDDGNSILNSELQSPEDKRFNELYGEKAENEETPFGV